MNAVDILNISSLQSAALSPDGKSVVFIKGETNWQKNRVVQNLWLVPYAEVKGADVKGANGKARQLTFDDSDKTRVAWSPNGRYISFVANRKVDKSKPFKAIYVLSMGGGEARRLSSYRADIRTYKWAADGQSVFFLASGLLEPEIEKKRKQKDDIFAFETALSYQQIWQLSVQGGQVKEITEATYHVLDFVLSADGKKIALNKSTGDKIDDWHDSEIWLQDVNGAGAQQLTYNNFAERNLEFSPDGKFLLFLADVNLSGDYYYGRNIFTIALKTKALRLLTQQKKFSVENAHWSREGDSIFLKANMGIHTELFSLAADGCCFKQLTNGKHTLKNWSYNRQVDKHLFTVVNAVNAGEISSIEGKKYKIREITKIHKELARRYKIPKQTVVHWQTEDGTEIEGLLSYPLDYKKGKKYPLVVHAHGGPASSDQYGQFRWSTYIPLLAANGYFHFSANYRGSRGYGDDFMRDMVGGYFNHAHTDVLSGVDFLIKQGLIDPDKLIMRGWSAGGHMTNQIITMTDRFAAASSGAGAVEWMSMYGESDTRYGRRFWFGGSPWQQDAPIRQFVKDSPLHNLWRVKTPTIIFVGEKDERVPPAQSKILYRALQSLGLETKLYIAPREPHSFQELRHRLFKINAELDWFNRHLSKQAYQWQTAPVKQH